MITRTTLDAETKSAIVEAVRTLLDAYTEGGYVEFSAERGVDEVTLPGAPIEQWRLNETATISIKINGGAVERRGLGMAKFIAYLADAERD